MIVTRAIIFIVIAYLCGSILFGRVAAALFHKDITGDSIDGVPGTSNAYKYGGFGCGTLTLAGDVLKGLIPVFFFLRWMDPATPWFLRAFLIAAPVIGHILPVFFKFRGGKGNATTFAVLFALMPVLGPFIILAAVFIILTVLIRISPNYYTLIVTYVITLILVLIGHYGPAITLGFSIIAVAVLIRMFASREEKEKMEVRFIWMH
ncbi:MAG: glycerol-3-phosphate acyltransferase [Lachnospiraceae bacterium]|nr:glycerol-3-phosphate acyltransferase [Lachnospiraceae bacterium]